MSLKLKKNDTVVVLTGKAKGKTGKILRVVVEKNRAFVEKLMIVKRHVKPTKQNPQGGIIEKESSINISNLMYYCSSCKKGVRLGAKIVGQKKVRVCKKCQEVVDKVS